MNLTEDLKLRLIRDNNALVLETMRDNRSDTPFLSDWSTPSLNSTDFNFNYATSNAESYVTGYTPESLTIKEDNENIYIKLVTDKFFGFVDNDIFYISLNITDGSKVLNIFSRCHYDYLFITPLLILC